MNQTLFTLEVQDLKNYELKKEREQSNLHKYTGNSLKNFLVHFAPNLEKQLDSPDSMSVIKQINLVKFQEDTGVTIKVGVMALCTKLKAAVKT